MGEIKPNSSLLTGIPRRTIARIRRNAIPADSLVPARLRHAIVDVHLAPRTRKSKRTRTLEPINQIRARASVQARPVLALVHIDLALHARKARHAHTPERSRIVQTAAIVPTRMTLALVHVRLASRPRESLRTVARKRSGRIHTDSVVLARRSLLTLVDVLGAIDALVTGSARARKRPIDRTRIANGVRMARIRCARIVQMTQQPGFALRAPAIEAAHTIDTRGPVEACRIHTIIDVRAAIGARPAVHANARVSTVCVRARRPILADARP